jgi:hypothetical protein
MPTTKLLETLLQIERSLGRADNVSLRNLLMDAQTEVLRIQRDSIEVMEELRRMRERRDTQMPVSSWRAIARALGPAEAEKDAAKVAGPMVVVERAS